MVNSPHCTSGQGLQELRQAVTRWRLVEGGLPFQTPSSVLQRVFFRGKPAFLKVALCEEELRGAALLNWWNGESAVQVWGLHHNAALLECAGGSRSLAEMARTGGDDDASRIICGVAVRLHKEMGADAPELMPLAQWFNSLVSAEASLGGTLQELSQIARSLLENPQHSVVLHGDLHHGNVLDGGSRGWLAIDPKGLLGERGFDFANLFCNPDHQTATQTGRFERQVEVVAMAASLERPRLLQWIAAWAGLSAMWHMESGGKPDMALAVGEKALRALRG